MAHTSKADDIESRTDDGRTDDSRIVLGLLEYVGRGGEQSQIGRAHV